MLTLYFVPIEYYSSQLSLVQNILWFSCYLTYLFVIVCDVWLTCKGICERHKALKPADSGSRGGESRYSAGQKRCATCELFIKWDGIWCPCCGCRLRANPRNTVHRRRVRRRKRLVIYLPNLWEAGKSSFLICGWNYGDKLKLRVQMPSPSSSKTW